MATSYSVVINSFLHKVEKDKSFFNYVNLTDSQAMEMATIRAKQYLIDSINRLMMDGVPSVDFSDRDDQNNTFNFNLVPQELVILPSLMYEEYLERDISYLKVLNVNYTSTDLRVFDPSNARSSFMDIYRFVCGQNKELLNVYRDTDRDTGKYKTLVFADYDTDE